MTRKKILFLTGTRADFGKLKPLILKTIEDPELQAFVFVTGMHTLLKYGNTVDEVYKSLPDTRQDNGFRNIFVFRNQVYAEPMEHILANTIQGLSRYVSELAPDLIVIHGDRIEALAGATVGALRNILVAHVEGGELSGTIDELIRHAASKMSHIHFVSHEKAAKRLRQLGERDDSIFVIGSPDIDLMLSTQLPSLNEVTKYYEIPFSEYGIVIFHPVTTDLPRTKTDAKNLVKTIMSLPNQNFVVIYPNNDEGCDLIFQEYASLENLDHVLLLPSMRVEYFFTLLKNSQFILGNSSAGVTEAPVYGVKSINISHRQKNRHQSASIFNSEGEVEDLINLLEKTKEKRIYKPDFTFGKGDSADKFIACLKGQEIWNLSTQKQFQELD